jgi:quercetin dioxygenase-like cupin family protein
VQIAYLLSGVCLHQIGGKSLKVSKGDIFPIPPGIAHTLNSIEAGSIELRSKPFYPNL